MVPAWLAFFDGLLALALVAAGIVAAHFRFAPPFVGFQIFVLGFLLSIVGAIVGAIGLLRTRSPERAAARPRAIVGAVISLAIAIPIVAIIISGRKYPPINDITTDADNPPEFVAALKLPANAGRDMKYDKAKYFARQKQGYGDVKPLQLEDDPEDAFPAVKQAAAAMPNWQITSADPNTMTIEGVCTSNLFHFQDDFVIQLRPGPDGGTLVEMRSKSRDGVGDFGVNRRRIKRFFSRLSKPAESDES
jgi:uncharacterized protein (DUF1499 family)